MRTKKMPYANVNGQRLYYEDTGGTGPVVAFSHGILFDTNMFNSQVATLRGKYRCITWDERGHGKTAGDTLERFSFYDSADDLNALLKFLGVRRAFLAGVSQGGFLGMRCALCHPDRVRGLILIASQTGTGDPVTPDEFKQMTDTWIAHNLPDEVAAGLESLVFRPNWPGAGAWRQKWRAMTAPNIAGVFDTLISRDDIGAQVAAIRVPTLIIHGDADAAIPLAKAQAMQAAIRGAELVMVRDGDHSVNLTQPDPVNAAIQAFFEKTWLDKRDTGASSSALRRITSRM
jgi:pimeloyl-ACP methyl ester carboxylesterase